MTSRERTFLGLSIAAFLVPNAMVIAYLLQHGPSFSAYLDAWVRSLPAVMLSTDLLICFLAFTIWSLWEGRRLKMRAWWLAIPATLFVGLCFAIPLFLFVRERALRPQPLSPGPLNTPKARGSRARGPRS